MEPLSYLQNGATLLYFRMEPLSYTSESLILQNRATFLYCRIEPLSYTAEQSYSPILWPWACLVVRSGGCCRTIPGLTGGSELCIHTYGLVVYVAIAAMPLLLTSP